MKAVIATAVLFAILLLGVMCNMLYVQFVVDRLEAELSALPSPTEADFSARADGIDAFWRSNAPFLTLSVDYTLIDRLNENFSVLVASAEARDTAIARATVAKLLDAVGNLERVK